MDKPILSAIIAPEIARQLRLAFLKIAGYRSCSSIPEFDGGETGMGNGGNRGNGVQEPISIEALLREAAFEAWAALREEHQDSSREFFERAYLGHYTSVEHYAVSLVDAYELDAKLDRYNASTDPTDRKQLAEEVQRSILENYYLVPIFRHAFLNAIGPRIDAKKWQDVFPTITTGYAYPWEDIRLKG